MTPRVSVIMTIYNPGRFLAPAIDSVLAQTMPDFELVAVENGSTDGSKGLLRNYSARDARIRVIDLERNIGRVPALNLALREARAEFAAVLDADDVARSDRLQRQLALFENMPELVVAGSHTRLIDENGQDVGACRPSATSDQLYDSFAFENPLMHSSVIYRLGNAIAAGGYPDTYIFSHDLALWLKLIAPGRVAMIPEPLVDIREHGGRLTRDASIRMRRYQEVLQVAEQCMSLPGISAEARRLAYITRARWHYFFAVDLFWAGKPVAAFSQLARCFWMAPGFCFQAIRTRLRMVRERIFGRAASSSLDT